MTIAGGGERGEKREDYRTAAADNHRVTETGRARVTSCNAPSPSLPRNVLPPGGRPAQHEDVSQCGRARRVRPASVFAANPLSTVRPRCTPFGLQGNRYYVKVFGRARTFLRSVTGFFILFFFRVVFLPSFFQTVRTLKKNFRTYPVAVMPADRPTAGSHANRSVF